MADLVGRQLGNYRLTQLLGQGAFAEVYLGQHIYLNTEAAVKVLKGQMTPQELQTFQQEAQIVAKLRHPNIVRVLEFGIENGRPFLIMDRAYASLRDYYSVGSMMSLKEVVRYIKQLAAALQYAHNQNIIHRDVKPQNMLIDTNGDLLLSDFGLAVITQRIQSFTLQDAAGTIVYMAPEQIEGKPRFASDQYSLGVVVYEWLSGIFPFSGSSYIEIAMKHISAPPPSLKDNLWISPHVEQVVLKALAKDPHERFPTVQAFADALEEARKVPHFSVQVFQETGKAPSLGTQLLCYRGYAGLVYSVIWSPNGTWLASGSSEHAIQVLEAKSGKLLYTYRGHSSLPVKMSWSPDGTQIASGSYDDVQIWKAKDGKLLYTYSGQNTIENSVSWSPDGTRIASGSFNDVQIWEPKDGKLLHTYRGHKAIVTSISWSPDGTRIASGSTDNTVQIWEAKSGKLLYTYTGHIVSWSPDGTRIASGSADNTVQIWEAKSGRVLYTCTGHTDTVFALNWSPDGTRLASSSSDHTVRVWEAKSGRELCIYRGHSHHVYGLAWSPDGTRIASGSLDGTVQIWQAV